MFYHINKDSGISANTGDKVLIIQDIKILVDTLYLTAIPKGTILDVVGINEFFDLPLAKVSYGGGVIAVSSSMYTIVNDCWEGD